MFAKSCDDDYRRSGNCSVFPHLSEELPAVHDGHHEVEQDKTGSLNVVEGDEALFAVGGRLDRVSFRLENCSNHIADSRIIIDQKNNGFVQAAPNAP